MMYEYNSKEVYVEGGLRLKRWLDVAIGTAQGSRGICLDSSVISARAESIFRGTYRFMQVSSSCLAPVGRK